MENYSIFTYTDAVEKDRLAHGRSYGRITGEQDFIDRMLNAAALDTGFGQIIQNLKFRMEVDPLIPSQVNNYNPLQDPQVEGYRDQWEEFITSTSPRETAIRIRMLEANSQRRRS